MPYNEKKKIGFLDFWRVSLYIRETGVLKKIECEARILYLPKLSQYKGHRKTALNMHKLRKTVSMNPS